MVLSACWKTWMDSLELEAVRISWSGRRETERLGEDIMSSCSETPDRGGKTMMAEVMRESTSITD